VTREEEADEVLTLKQVAAITGLALQTHYNMRSKDEGPRLWPLRGRLRCYRSELEAWMREQSGAANVTPLKRSA